MQVGSQGTISGRDSDEAALYSSVVACINAAFKDRHDAIGLKTFLARTYGVGLGKPKALVTLPMAHLKEIKR